MPKVKAPTVVVEYDNIVRDSGSSRLYYFKAREGRKSARIWVPYGLTVLEEDYKRFTIIKAIADEKGLPYDKNQ